MTVQLLGPVRVVVNGDDAVLGGAKPRTVLAALATRPGRAVTAARLVELVWDGDAPDSAVGLVHSYVAAVRRGLRPLGLRDALVTTANGYLLAPDRIAVDLDLFLADLSSARAAERDGATEAARARYATALGRWRGEAFDGVDAGFARELAAGLAEDRFAAELGLSRGDLATGRLSEAVARLTRCTDEHPLREEPRALLMTALHRDGRTAEALAAYQHGRALVRGTLGVDPGRRLRESHQAILTGPARPRQLPPDIPGFLGRDREVHTATRVAAGGARATIVVTGPPGAGKSALAVHIAHLLKVPTPTVTCSPRWATHPSPRYSGNCCAHLARPIRQQM